MRTMLQAIWIGQTQHKALTLKNCSQRFCDGKRFLEPYVSGLLLTIYNRTWKPHNAHLNKIFVQSRLQYKIDQDSYHMSYIVGSEDAFVRPPAAARKKDQVDVTNEAAEWRQWLESRSTGWSKDIESDDACKAREEEERKLLSE